MSALAQGAQVRPSRPPAPCTLQAAPRLSATPIGPRPRTWGLQAGLLHAHFSCLPARPAAETICRVPAPDFSQSCKRTAAPRLPPVHHHSTPLCARSRHAHGAPVLPPLVQRPRFPPPQPAFRPPRGPAPLAGHALGGPAMGRAAAGACGQAEGPCGPAPPPSSAGRGGVTDLSHAPSHARIQGQVRRGRPGGATPPALHGAHGAGGALRPPRAPPCTHRAPCHPPLPAVELRRRLRASRRPAGAPLPRWGVCRPRQPARSNADASWEPLMERTGQRPARLDL